MTRKIKVCRAVFGVAIVLTLAFIFAQSLLPPDTSSVQSGNVAKLLAEILDVNSPVVHFAVTNIRKIAHFTEYGVLGVWVALLFLTCESRTAAKGAVSIAFGFGVGFFDESLQMLSGRGPTIADVWIDAAGYVFFGCIVCLFGRLWICMRKSKSSPPPPES